MQGHHLSAKLAGKGKEISALRTVREISVHSVMDHHAGQSANGEKRIKAAGALDRGQRRHT